MYELFTITTSVRSKRINVALKARSENVSDFSITLKVLKTNTLDGWLLYDGDELQMYNLPKSLGINSLAELDAILTQQIHDMV